MVSVGEQQEALLLRELETDITVARCVEIMSYLEQNIALVHHGSFVDEQRYNSKQAEVQTTAGHVGSLQFKIELFNRLNESQVEYVKTKFLKAREQFFQVIKFKFKLFQKKVALLSEYDHGEFLRSFISIFKNKCSNLVSQYDAVFGSVINGTQEISI